MPAMPESPLWSPGPDHVARAQVTRFIHEINRRHGLALAGYDALWKWSVENLESFWEAVWDFCGVKSESRGERVLADAGEMPGARFFPDARLNFAENLL